MIPGGSRRFTKARILLSLRGVKTPRFLLSPLLVLALSAADALSQTTIVDIVPASQSKEHAQNAEPNIAVDPCDPTKIVISAFGAPTNPIFMSKDGAKTWSLLQKVPAGDISIGWAGAYNAYLTTLSPKGTSLATMRLHDPTAKSAFRAVPKSIYKPGNDGPDQPWTEAALVDGVDCIYIAFNDLSRATRTASIRQSLDGGRTWQNFVLERQDPGLGFDGAAVRVAINGNRVYGAWQRFNSEVGSDIAGDIIVVRDDTGGAGGYANIGAFGVGVVVATGERLPQGLLGQERLGSDLSIAVDPNDPDRVVVAYAAIRGGQTLVSVNLSIDAGVTWNEIGTTPGDSALPAVAIAGNGVIGLLYTFYDGTNLETHLVQSADEFATETDLTLSKFADQSLSPDFDPYIGDYQDLVAVGDDFYGTFSASNNTAAFPQTPIFLRDKTLLGTAKVPFSIDPFFFKTPALP